MERLYAAGKYRAKKDWCSEENLCKEILSQRRKNPNSSTGYGEQQHTLTLLLEKESVESLARRCQAAYALLREDKYDGTVTFFVKREPLTTSKLDDRRPRLIANLPLLIKILTGALLRPYLDRQCEACEDIPSKHGYTWVKGGTHRFFRRYDDMTPNHLECDKKNHDATVPGCAYPEYQKHIERLCMNPEDFDSEACTLLLNYHAKPDRILLSNGTLLRQVDPGVIKSGGIMTIDMNSWWQVFNKVGFVLTKRPFFEEKYEWCAAVGDDTIDRMRPGEASEYLAYLNSKGFITQDEKQGFLLDLSFVGKTFAKVDELYVFKPKYFDKNVWSLTWKEPRHFDDFEATLDSYCTEYAYSEHFKTFHNLLLKEAVSDDGQLRPDSRWRSEKYYKSMHLQRH